jgi:hypothetical protein
MLKPVKLLCACLFFLAVNVPSHQAQTPRTGQQRPNVVTEQYGDQQNPCKNHSESAFAF